MWLSWWSATHPTCDAGWAKCEPLSDGKESIDRRSIDLQPAQEQLIRDVLQANPRTIVVLKASFPVRHQLGPGECAAIVHMAHNRPGGRQRSGDVLFGDYNPAGRLVQTWVKSIDRILPR